MEENQAVTEVNQLAETPAPEQVATAAPETDAVSTPEEAPAETPSKVFTQEELDAAIGKRLAREQRKWERQRQQELEALKPPVQSQASSLVQEQFESPEAYADALAMQKAEQLLAQREVAKRQREVLEGYHEREEEARGKYDDFEQVAYNPSLPITAVMAETIQASEAGPDVAYYLGSNPKEADRIARMSPLLQAKEIGKIEAKLAESPPVKQSTKAPAPIQPVKPNGNPAPAYDTTDPRSVKTMTTSEWIEADRRRQMKKFEAQRNR